MRILPRFPRASARGAFAPRLPALAAAVLAGVLLLMRPLGAAPGDAEAIQRRVETLRQGDTNARRASAVWLGEHGTMASAPALLEALRDADPGVRALSENAIWQVWMRSGDKQVDHQLAIGAEYLNEHRFQEALEVFDEVVRMAPEFAEGYNKRATALYYLGDYGRSMEDIHETLQRNPYHFGALSGAGLCMIAEHEPALALSYFEQALAINPNLEGVGQMVEQLKKITKEQMM